MTLIARGELVGDTFNRNFQADRGGVQVDLPHQRRVRIGVFLNDELGVLRFYPVSKLPFDLSSFPHIPLSGRLFDGQEYEGSSLTTVRKKGASTPYFDSHSFLEAHGATFERKPKTEGFTLSLTRKEIVWERKRKQIEQTHGQEAAAILSSSHRGPQKKGGFAFSATAYQIKKEREERIRRKREVKVQMKNTYLEFP